MVYCTLTYWEPVHGTHTLSPVDVQHTDVGCGARRSGHLAVDTANYPGKQLWVKVLSQSISTGEHLHTSSGGGEGRGGEGRWREGGWITTNEEGKLLPWDKSLLNSIKYTCEGQINRAPIHVHMYKPMCSYYKLTCLCLVEWSQNWLCWRHYQLVAEPLLEIWLADS